MPAEDVGCEPGEGFLAVWLRRTAKVRELGSVDAGNADVYLLKKKRNSQLHECKLVIPKFRCEISAAEAD